jgi:hypothetical protein
MSISQPAERFGTQILPLSEPGANSRRGVFFALAVGFS